MPIRLSGMASGLDTEAIVQGLSSAYQMKIDKVTKRKKTLTYQQDAWSTLNSKIYSFYTGTLSKVKTYGNYKTKAATVAGGTKASMKVKASSDAVEGSYKVKINSTASAAFLTSARLASAKYTASYAATNATTFQEMYDENGSKLSDSLIGKSLTFEGTQMKAKKDADGNELYTLDIDGAAASIDLYDAAGNVTGTVTEATTAQIEAYLSKIKEKDPDHYDSSKYYVAAVLEQGDALSAFTYTFTENSSVSDINKALTDAGFTGLSAEMQEGKIVFGNTAGMTTNADGSIRQTGASYSISGADALTALGLTADASGKVDVNTTATKETDGEGKESYTYNRIVTSSKKLQYDVADTALSGKSKLSEYLGDAFKNNALTDADGKKYIEFDLVMGSGATAKTTTLKITEDMTVNDFTKAIQDASGGKVTASFDAKNQRFFLNSKETGSENGFSLEASSSAGSEEALKKLGLIDGNPYTGNSAMSKQAATDAEIVLNGAVLTSSSNDVKVDSLGLTLTVESAAPDEELSLNVSKDTDGVYKMVKDFLKEYNNLVKDMSELYYAEKTDYEPLTDEEEDEMSDKQVEKWEEKVKAAVLRRDDSLYSIMNTMRNGLAQTVSVKDKDGTSHNYSLSYLGISTGNYLEYGILHLAGDEDDAEYASKTNKLKNLIEEDPDKVMNILAGVTSNLYQTMTKKMKSTTLNSYQKLYNDKTMKKQSESYDDEIDKLKEKLESVQDKYYQQFSKMETALSKLNSTASSLGFGSTTS